ncbi:MAG: AraC family transcriptional regulator [Kiritimatiellaeota bacterium]|nr:AraC family transcriptional regulator [Kiritimatiellota bacterium]
MKTDLNSLSPYVRYVRTHASRGLSQAYIDPDFVFTYIFEGVGHFLLEGKEYPVKRGDMILMPPYMLHVIRAPAGGSIVQYVIHFDCRYALGRRGAVKLHRGMTFKEFIRTAHKADRILASWLPVISPPPEAHQKLEDLFLRLQREFIRKSHISALVCKAIMLEILAIYLVNADKPARAESIRFKGWRNLEKAIAFIQCNLQHPLELEDICRAAGISKYYCCRLFKNYTHTSMHRYLNLARIQRAKILIEKAELNFSQIAAEVGFSSVHLFSRIFKKIEDMPPAEYAKSKFRHYYGGSNRQ